MFIKILTKTYGSKTHYYASIVENNRVNGHVVQTVKANIGAVTLDQIPFLKAAYAKVKPRLIYNEETDVVSHTKEKAGGDCDEF